MSVARPVVPTVIGICLLGALLNGLSGFDSHSNHPTYLPPALQYLDPNYLSADWWLSSAFHYHLAYFALAVGLGSLGVLEWGLAVLNIIVVTTALFACHRIIKKFGSQHSIPVLAILIALMLCTRSFYSAGDSYLFSSSLQPSSIAAMATICAMVAFLEQRLVACGLLLALGGIFHANFLIVNLPFFGLLQLLATIDLKQPRNLLARSSLKDFLRLLGPSLVILAMSTPLILALTRESLTPAEAEQASWIFFNFAVPFHYVPAANPAPFVTLAGWQILGLVWTASAVPDRETRHKILSIQAALFLILWTATALTTLIFVPQVSRLFVWRLAPFAVLLSAIIFVVGVLREFTTAQEPGFKQRSMLSFGISLSSILLLAQPAGGLEAQFVSTRPFSPVVYPLLLLLVLSGVRRFAAETKPVSQPVMTALAAGALTWAFLTQPGDWGRTRYNLIASTSLERDEQQLFAFVRDNTPRDAQFAIPPDLELFRLRARRAVIVDMKALPLNGVGLIEWYRRLGEVSNTSNPINANTVHKGYQTLDAERLTKLRGEYGIDYAVVRIPGSLVAPDWQEVFANERFRVLAHKTGQGR